MSWQESRLNDPARRLVVIGVMRCGRFRIIIVLAYISVRRSVHSTVFNVVFSIIWRLGVLFKKE
jgi:hypothetical protein